MTAGRISFFCLFLSTSSSVLSVFRIYYSFFRIKIGVYRKKLIYSPLLHFFRLQKWRIDFVFSIYAPTRQLSNRSSIKMTLAAPIQPRKTD